MEHPHCPPLSPVGDGLPPTPTTPQPTYYLGRPGAVEEEALGCRRVATPTTHTHCTHTTWCHVIVFETSWKTAWADQSVCDQCPILPSWRTWRPTWRYATGDSLTHMLYHQCFCPTPPPPEGLASPAAACDRISDQPLDMLHCYGISDAVGLWRVAIMVTLTGIARSDIVVNLASILMTWKASATTQPNHCGDGR